MSGVFIQILTTRTRDPVTGSNFKRWLQRDNLPWAEIARLMLESGESRTGSVEKNLRRVKLSHEN